MDGSRRSRRTGRIDECSVLVDVNRIGRDDANTTVDSSARVEARGRLDARVGLDRKHVLRAKLDVLRHVVTKAHVAVGMIPELGSVDIDGAVAHHAVKFNVDLLARRDACGKREVGAVPTDSRR